MSNTDEGARRPEPREGAGERRSRSVTPSHATRCPAGANQSSAAVVHATSSSASTPGPGTSQGSGTTIEPSGATSGGVKRPLRTSSPSTTRSHRPRSHSIPVNA